MTQADQTWDYAAVEISAGRRGRRRGRTGLVEELIDELTTSGWRPMTTVTRPGRYHGGTWTYLRRRATDCRP